VAVRHGTVTSADYAIAVLRLSAARTDDQVLG
jgi:hypothetical protein